MSRPFEKLKTEILHGTFKAEKCFPLLRPSGSDSL